MVRLTVAELTEAVDGRLVFGEPAVEVTALSTDTRTLKAGDFFIPLVGERFNGHDFLDLAIRRGAAGFLTQGEVKRMPSNEAAVVRVRNCRAALWRIAQLVRGRLSSRVIGVTGSTGKTCTKEMLAAVTVSKFKSLVSPRNYNNEIGVPLTITEAQPETEILVVEMAMRGRGQIAALAALAQPEIGIVTNIGDTHYELLGSHQAIADAKAELVEALPAAGLAVLNADDEWTPQLRERTVAQVVTFGIEKDSDVRATGIRIDNRGRASFTLRTGAGKTSVRLPVSGRHQVYNALAAAAAAEFLGLSGGEIAEGLAGTPESSMRMQFVRLANGATAINDAYNANPTSMEAALATLASIDCSGRRIAILGDMAELGKISDASHYRVGRAVADSKVDLLVTVGESAVRFADGAAEGGLPRSSIHTFGGASEAADFLKGTLAPDDLLLVKASRVMALDEIVAELAKED